MRRQFVALLLVVKQLYEGEGSAASPTSLENIDEANFTLVRGVCGVYTPPPLVGDGKFICRVVFTPPFENGGFQTPENFS